MGNEKKGSRRNMDKIVDRIANRCKLFPWGRFRSFLIEANGEKNTRAKCNRGGEEKKGRGTGGG